LTPVGAIHLDHPHPLLGEMAGQPGAIGAQAWAAIRVWWQVSPGSGSLLHRVIIVGEGDGDGLVDQVGEVGLGIAAVGDMSGIEPCLIGGAVDGICCSATLASGLSSVGGTSSAFVMIAPRSCSCGRPRPGLVGCGLT